MTPTVDEAREAAGPSVALDALADLQIEAGHVVNEVVRARIDVLIERARAGIQYEAWDRAELIAAVDAVLKPEEGADPLPDDEWEPVFLRLRNARAALAATPARGGANVTTVDEARAAQESYVHLLAPTKTLTGEQHQQLMRLTDALIAAVRAEYSEHVDRYQYETDTAMDYGAGLAEGRAESAETLRALREALLDEYGINVVDEALGVALASPSEMEVNRERWRTARDSLRAGRMDEA